MKEKFYAVQMLVDGFGHDTTTMICFRTEDECKEWIKRHATRISKNIGHSATFEVVEQAFGKEFEEIWG